MKNEPGLFSVGLDAVVINSGAGCSSLYWDDFELRIAETLEALKTGEKPSVRRVAVFVTDRCNFRCKYCNHRDKGHTLTEDAFRSVVDKYGDTAIIHITGGEPSVVPWLYPFLRQHGHKYRFHLNTNAYITPPFESVKRLKISLDHQDGKYWDCLVGRDGAFSSVVENIKRAIPYTVVSITYTLTKENYRNAPNFARFVNREMAGLYAVFFSVYKGTEPAYVMTDQDAAFFFSMVLPELEVELSSESLALIRETIDEKRRLIQGVRFPQNAGIKTCYISMSERVISSTGEEFTCSHLYRDGIYRTTPEKHDKCLYGCNRRLVQFNEQVETGLFGCSPRNL